LHYLCAQFAFSSRRQVRIPALRIRSSNCSQSVVASPTARTRGRSAPSQEFDLKPDALTGSAKTANVQRNCVTHPHELSDRIAPRAFQTEDFIDAETAFAIGELIELASELLLIHSA
jgi:hypothetical protein